MAAYSNNDAGEFVKHLISESYIRLEGVESDVLKEHFWSFTEHQVCQLTHAYKGYYIMYIK